MLKAVLAKQPLLLSLPGNATSEGAESDTQSSDIVSERNNLIFGARLKHHAQSFVTLSDGQAQQIRYDDVHAHSCSLRRTLCDIDHFKGKRHHHRAASFIFPGDGQFPDAFLKAMGQGFGADYDTMVGNFVRDPAMFGRLGAVGNSAKINASDLMRIGEKVYNEVSDKIVKGDIGLQIQMRHRALGLGNPSCPICPRGKNWDAPCPRNWDVRNNTTVGLPECLPPDTYTGVCNKAEDFNLADKGAKEEAEAICDVCWPCFGDSGVKLPSVR